MKKFVYFLRGVTGVTAFLALANCGGGAGGTGTVGPTVPTVQPTDFPTTQATVDTLINTYLDSDGRVLSAFAVLDAGLIPTQGTATYEGFLAGNVDGLDLVASLAVEADFARSDISAVAGAFQRSDGQDLSGSLTGDGSIQRANQATAPQLQMTLSGTVDGDMSSILLDGAFLTNAGENETVSIAGQAEGLIGDSIFEDGAFAAE